MVTFLTIYLVIGAILTTLSFAWALYEKEPAIINANIIVVIYCLIICAVFYPFLFVYYWNKYD